MLQKRLDFGFNGYEVPFNFIPRAARSTRRRGPMRKKIVDNQMCAFDLLATVAGKLLLEGEDACCVKDQDVTVEDVLIKEQDDSGFHLESRLADMNEFVEHHDGVGELFSGSGLDMHCSEDPTFFDRKTSALVTSDSSVKVSSGQKQLLHTCGLLPPSRGNNIKIVTRDDDDNSSECAQPSTTNASRSRARIGDRRIRKLLASKYWRVAPKVKDGDFHDTELRSVYRSWKIGYKRRRSRRMYPFKKRKFFHYSCKGVYNSREKAIGTTASGFGAVGHGVNGSSSCVAGQNTTFSSRESHVKLRIKSFRVPELFIEMPETTTVGSLKRTVMEAVTALIGGGLQVGVLVQGNKIRDDNRTLLQSGICHDDKVESLGFTLEPNPSQTSVPVCADDNSVVVSTDVTEPLSRCPAIGTILQGTCYVSLDDPMTNLGHLIESDHDSAPSPSEKGMIDSQALVALPEGTPHALAVVPANQKSKESEIGQRRIRRPFSVAEVEALVEAVEKLGTGRWRDVKLRAFDNVKHRTYIDLKDKWKTLVHTARISPQQRRGQPVPQNVLDRVLAAHAYWSQLQAKHHLKQHSEACRLL